MKWKFCEFCYINGHCENQDRGHKCECYGKKLEDKCERLENRYDRAKWWLNEIVKNHRFTPISTAEKALEQIKELDK